MYSTIFVDYQPFFGRVEEQQRFRAALEDVLNSTNEEKAPYLFWLSGDAGIGKSTLARRFCDITTRTQPQGQFEVLWVDCLQQDWQANLSLGGELIGAERVFEMLYRVAQEHQWDEYFERYQTILHRCQMAEREAAAALTTVDEQGLWVPLSAISAADFAQMVRAQGSYEMQPSKTFDLQALIERRLRTKMLPQQFNLFIHPEEELALAMADGLKRLATKQPLVVVLDSYEVVAEADYWLQPVVEAAGSQVVWIIAGRHNALQQPTQAQTTPFINARSSFPRRFIVSHMERLSTDEIRAYFSTPLFERPLDEEGLNTISRVTRGIPLAVREAADIWATGKPMSAIVGDTTEATPSSDIVQKMTERYLVHCINNKEDKRTLYTLALARGDDQLLQALLSQNDPTFDLAAYLHQLERRYSSVYSEKSRLHEEPAAFLLEDLRTRLRQTSWVQSLVRQALTLIEERLTILRQAFPTIEARSQNEGWIKAVIDKSYYLFWLNFETAYQWLIPRFVESLAYNYNLKRALLRVMQDWKGYLSPESQQRINILQESEQELPILFKLPPSEAELLAQLSQLAEEGWLAGEGESESERHAILSLRRANWLFQQQQYQQALHLYEKVEEGLPTQGEELKRQLAEALLQLTVVFIWPNNQSGGIYSYDAERILPKVLQWLPEKPGAWYCLGANLNRAHQYDEAIAAFHRAIELEPTYVSPYHGLGNIYDRLEQYDKAKGAYQQAIALSPDNPFPHYGLGNVYRALRLYDDAIASYEHANRLDASLGYPYHGLGQVYRELGRHDDAILAFQKAIYVNPTDVYPHNGLAHVYRALERYDEAIGAYQQASDINPSDPYPHHGLGQIYRRLGRYDKAIAAFEQAIKLEPTDTYPYNGLGHVYRALGHHHKAIRAFQQATDLDPLDAYAYKALAEAYDEVGHYQEALSAWQKASQLDPTDPAPYHELGLVYRTLGHFDKAIKAYQQAIPLDPNDAYPYHGLGNIYLTLGRYHEAEASYKRALDLDPQNAFAHQNLATIYLHQRKLKQAQHQLHQRIRLLPDNTFTSLLTLGVISYHQNVAGSQKLFQQALANWDIAWQQQLEPPAELLENKAIALFCIGEAASAEETLTHAIKQTLPRHPTSLDRYKLLQSAPLPPRGIEKMIQML
jgi:tetratricopeptide (TPR) repeat protein